MGVGVPSTNLSRELRNRLPCCRSSPICLRLVVDYDEMDQCNVIPLGSIVYSDEEKMCNGDNGDFLLCPMHPPVKEPGQSLVESVARIQ